MPRSTLPPQLAVESYDPRLLTLLERGAAERIVVPGDIPPPNDRQSLEERQALCIRQLRHMQNRLNTLRSALYKVGDERGKRLYRTIVRVDKDNLALVVEPRDAQLGNLLSKIPSLNPAAEPEAASTLDDLAARLNERE